MMLRPSKSNKRNPIPSVIEAKLMVEARRTCCLCFIQKPVQIHHIVPVELGGDCSEDNLIVVCCDCHAEVHTRREMARNISPMTQKLYKATWLGIVRAFPVDQSTGVKGDNDLTTIREILKQAHRPALFFPFDLEDFPKMFSSLNEFRVFIQRSGYRLLQSPTAMEHVHQIYRALLEVLAFVPRHPAECHHAFYGRDGLAGIELRRQTARFHINELAKLAGFAEVIPERSDIRFEDMRQTHQRFDDKKCFGRFDDSNDCQQCDFRVECIESSAARSG